ncbi:MAG: FAD-dependent monooxygenase, partial [Pseudomonadota bacterium]
MTHHDVVIIGAGPAGLSFARLLAEIGLDICVLEKQSEKTIANPSYDGREIALTHHSHKIMSDCEMWAKIPEKGISLIKDAKVLNGDLTNSLFFDHRISGKDNLGYMISNHLIRKAAYDIVKTRKNIKLITDVEVAHVQTNDFNGVVTLKDGVSLSAKLVVAADSRFSTTRDMMGIPVARRDFGRT